MPEGCEHPIKYRGRGNLQGCLMGLGRHLSWATRAARGILGGFASLALGKPQGLLYGMAPRAPSPHILPPKGVISSSTAAASPPSSPPTSSGPTTTSTSRTATCCRGSSTRCTWPNVSILGAFLGVVFFFIFGRYDTDGCSLCSPAESGSALTVWGTGKPRRQFIYSLVGVGLGFQPRLSPPGLFWGLGSSHPNKNPTTQLLSSGFGPALPLGAAGIRGGGAHHLVR